MGQTVTLLYGKTGMQLTVPDSAAVLEGQHPPAITDPGAVASALAAPIGTAPLAELVRKRRPATVAITVSDITRPVPNRDFLPQMLAVLNGAGVADNQIVIIIGTGMHRPSTPQERETILGREVLSRVEVIDHTAADPSTLVKVCDDPPVSLNARFARADFRIVTGYVEPHFMAGFSGGRKGVCPALVDLPTIQKFHGFATLADPNTENGVLADNPCHEISLKVAKAVGVDFLFNVAITRERRIAGIYCGDLEAAHAAGCAQVAKWTTARVDKPFDLVITNNGGYPLDEVFYQANKAMCCALPALAPGGTLLVAANCAEGLGSRDFADLLLGYENDWRRFVREAGATSHTRLDQWGYQMQCKALARTGIERLLLACDGIDMATQRRMSVTPLDGAGDARARSQRFIDKFAELNPAARIAVIPEGPYVMLKNSHPERHSED